MYLQMKNKKMRQYFKELRKILIRSHPSQKADEIISMLQNNAEDFFTENPNAEFEDFLEYFGDIEDLHFSFLENAQDLSKQIRQANSQKRLYAAVLIVVALAALICCAFLIKGYLDGRDSIIKYEQTIIY